MAAIDFPNSPVTNDTFTVGSKTWKYDGEKWIIDNESSQQNISDLEVKLAMEAW